MLKRCRAVLLHFETGFYNLGNVSTAVVTSAENTVETAHIGLDFLSYETDFFFFFLHFIASCLFWWRVH